MHYVFGDFSLDTARYELRRAGQVVPLRGKVFDVLAYLVRHADRVVSRDELLDQMWPEQFVAESTLTSCMKAVRQALGDTGRTQHLIKTVHGRGYRCLAPVSPLDPAAPEATLASSAPPQEPVLAPHAAPPVGELTPEACEALVPSAGDAAPVPELPSPPSVAPASVHPCAEAERRPLTVMVCDLVPAARLVEQLDPEDLRQVMRAYHTACERVLTQFDGYLAGAARLIASSAG